MNGGACDGGKLTDIFAVSVKPHSCLYTSLTLCLSPLRVSPAATSSASTLLSLSQKAPPLMRACAGLSKRWLRHGIVVKNNKWQKNFFSGVTWLMSENGRVSKPDGVAR